MSQNLQPTNNGNAFWVAKCVIVTIFFVFGVNWNANAQNILENAGFEEWEGNVPVKWFGDKSTLAKSNAMQDRDSKSGNFSLKLVNSKDSHLRYSSQSYLLDAAKEYELVYYVKGVGKIRNSFFDGETGYSGIAAYSTYQEIDNLIDWQQISYRFTPGKTTVTGQLNVQVIFSIQSTDAISGLLIDDVTLKEYMPTAIHQRTSNAKISVYRPNSDVIKVATSTGATSVTVVNATGNVVITVAAENDDKEITIPVKKIASGVYIVVVKLVDGTQVTTKIIK